jgi:hypothetical protein
MNKKFYLTVSMFWILVSGVFLLTILGGCKATPAFSDVASIPTSMYAGPVFTVTLDTHDNVKLGDLFNFTLEKDHLYANFMEDANVVGWVVIDTDNGTMCTSSRQDCELSELPQRYRVRFETGKPSNQVFVYDWQMYREILVPTGDNPWHPDIGDNIVAWQQRISDGWRVAGYNIDTQESYTITESQDYISHVRTGKDWIGYVVRSDARVATADIYVHHLPTQDQIHIAEIIYYESAHWQPYVLENERVAWVGVNNVGEPKVHIFNLITRQENILPIQASCRPIDVSLYADLVIYTCHGHRYGTDMTYNLTFEMPLFPSDVEFVNVKESLASTTKLVWILSPLATNGNYQVPELQIPEALPLQMYTASIVRE